ncbi:unnamed protein product [Durusdinium trenchii]|uniref:Uncharacterized protein n=1 Tax=Durusdinium trenchii TaxID=1381693 RepID=A0ABP0M8A0_9DINO
MWTWKRARITSFPLVIYGSLTSGRRRISTLDFFMEMGKAMPSCFAFWLPTETRFADYFFDDP